MPWAEPPRGCFILSFEVHVIDLLRHCPKVRGDPKITEDAVDGVMRRAVLRRELEPPLVMGFVMNWSEAA